jgi:hypothetical protein
MSRVVERDGETKTRKTIRKEREKRALGRTAGRPSRMWRPMFALRPIVTIRYSSSQNSTDVQPLRPDRVAGAFHLPSRLEHRSYSITSFSTVNRMLMN